MTALYVDASIVLRIALGQDGARAPIGKGSVVVSSEVTRIEVARALDRMRVAGSLDDATHAQVLASANLLMATFHLMPLADEMIAAACEKYSVEVTPLCAIHVATAQQMMTETNGLQFWTHLAPQALAALARGLDVRGGALGKS